MICGFGRTGNVWGCQTLNIKPDILTCARRFRHRSPISAVITDKVYQALMKESDKIGTWGHGFTYSGHPVAAAVALEAQKIYDEIDLFGHAKRTSGLQKHIQSFADHPLIGDVGSACSARSRSWLTRRPNAFGGRGRAGNQVSNHAGRAACSCAAWAIAYAICPPLIINETELADLFGGSGHALDAALGGVRWEGH